MPEVFRISISAPSHAKRRAERQRGGSDFPSIALAPLKRTRFATLAFLCALAMGLFGCAVLAPFNQYSFDETSRLKKEAFTLIGKAEQPYSLHRRKADSVLVGLNRAYQDASLRTKNQESMRRWEILLDTNQASLAGTVTRWRREGSLSAEVIAAARKDIAEDFAVISKLEGKKGK